MPDAPNRRCPAPSLSHQPPFPSVQVALVVHMEDGTIRCYELSDSADCPPLLGVLSASARNNIRKIQSTVISAKAQPPKPTRRGKNRPPQPSASNTIHAQLQAQQAARAQQLVHAQQQLQAARELQLQQRRDQQQQQEPDKQSNKQDKGADKPPEVLPEQPEQASILHMLRLPRETLYAMLAFDSRSLDVGRSCNLSPPPTRPTPLPLPHGRTLVVPSGRYLAPPPPSPPGGKCPRKWPKSCRGGGGPRPPVRDVHVDAPGQRRGQLPYSVWTRHRAVKQGNGGSAGTTYQGKGGGSRDVRVGQAGRGRAQGGERPMGTAPYGGNGFKRRAAVSGERPLGAARCRQQHNEMSWQHAPRPRA